MNNVKIYLRSNESYNLNSVNSFLSQNNLISFDDEGRANYKFTLFFLSKKYKKISCYSSGLIMIKEQYSLAFGRFIIKLNNCFSFIDTLIL